MFKKLRRHFLLINLAIMSAILLIAFFLVYTQMDMLIMHNHRLQLEFISRNFSFSEDMNTTTVYTIDADTQHFSVVLAQYPPLYGNYELHDDNFFDQAVELAESITETTGSIEFNGYTWLFQQNNWSIDEHATSFSVVTFYEVTEAMQMLVAVQRTFIFIGIVMLFVILITSSYFSKYTVHPIEKAFARQQQFIADASHELKTPLAIITSNSEVLTQYIHDEDGKKFMSYIKNQTKCMSSLVGNLLTLATYDAKEVVTNRQELNLSQAVENQVFTMEAMAYEKGLTMEFVADDKLQVITDKEKVNQVLTILLDNAMKYAKEECIIKVSLYRDGRLVVCDVANQVNEIIENPDKLFDRFYRSDVSRGNKKGYGLGLSIARLVAEELDGNLKARMEEDWIIFSFSLRV